MELYAAGSLRQESVSKEIILVKKRLAAVTSKLK